MSARFTDKVVVVIGGNSGIGLAAARAFAGEGAHVVLTGRNPETLRSAGKELGPRALPIQSEISDVRQTDALMEEIKRRHGRIDVLFVNAGIGAFLPIEAVTERDWEQIMGVNLKGVFFTVQKALPMMKSGASIVITSSIGWKMGIPTNSVYAASKAGVRALGRNFAAELVSRGIRVNVISPGCVETPIINRTPGLPPEAIPALREEMIRNTPMHRLGEPDEVARAALFLASDEASFITGIDMLVDGGAASF
ncbi:MAG TPA: SDR family oxidoreductase [Candidatus Baltobacteraceae bacterium]|nr:SDR family oxidoreductase [Candidatus Baltobacteraceae bacterium]